MPHAVAGGSDTTMRGRKVRAFGLGSLFLITAGPANPAFAHGSAAGWGQPSPASGFGPGSGPASFAGSHVPHSGFSFSQVHNAASFRPFGNFGMTSGQNADSAAPTALNQSQSFDTPGGFNTFANRGLAHYNAGAQFNRSLLPAMVGPTAALGRHPNLGAGLGLQHGLDLDLTSSIANIVLGSNLFTAADTTATSMTATVTVGGSQHTFQAGQKVTAAEYVAIKEVLSGGSQTLRINARGAAYGGVVDLNDLASYKFADIVIPRHVVAIDNFTSNSNVTISGDLVNYGSIYGISTDASVTSGTIFASDMTNRSGGVISTVIPANLKSDLLPNNLISGVSLAFNASGDFTNSGQISSAGALSVVAGRSIYNISGPGNAATSNTNGRSLPTMTAVGDLSLAAGSGNFVNAGLIASSGKNVTFSAPVTQNINIDSTGGKVQALQGDINVRDGGYSGANNINLVGGDYLSQNLNLNSGTGAITGAVGDITGNLNTKAGSAHVLASTDVLKLGSNKIDGDPLFVNAAGDIEITGLVDVTGNNEPLTIAASGDIFAQGSDPTAQLRNSGGDITLIAGAAISYSGTNSSSVPPGAPATATATIDFSTPSVNGGNIFLANSAASPIIDASSKTGNGGNVTLAALSNPINGGGFINLATSGTSIDTHSTISNGGNVTVIAGAMSGTGILLSTIDAGKGSLSGGTVSVYNARPTGNTSTSITYDIAGKVDSTSTSTAIVPGALQNAGIVVGTVKAHNLIVKSGNGDVQFDDPTINLQTDALGRGGTLDMQGGQLFFTGNLNVSALGAAKFGLGDGGTVKINMAKDITLGTAAGEIHVDAEPSSKGGNGGTINVTTGGKLTVDGSAPVAFNVNPTAADGDGGNIIFTAQSVAVKNATTFAMISTPGVNSGNGGVVSLTVTGNSPIAVGSKSGSIVMNSFGPSTGAGSGGSVTLSSKGSVFFDASHPSFEFSANGGQGGGDGGTLSLSAHGIDWTNSASQQLTLGVNAFGTGNGGTLSITDIDNKGLTTGIGAGQYELFVGTGPGASHGGTLSISTTGPLVINGARTSVAGPSGLSSNDQGTFNFYGSSVTSTGSTPATAGNINVVSGINGIGTSGSSLLTNSLNITAQSAGDVYINNTGSTTLGISSTPGAFNFSTTPDANGNGSITIGHLAFISAGTIFLTSSESGSGEGGITQIDFDATRTLSTATPSLYASSVTLKDSGNGNIVASMTNTAGDLRAVIDTAGDADIAIMNSPHATLSGFKSSTSSSDIRVRAQGGLKVLALPSSASSFDLEAGFTSVLSLPTANLQAHDASGNGGKITLSALQITYAGSGASPLTLDVSATSATGSGGTITLTDLQPTITIANTANAYRLLASGGATSGDGGGVTISTGQNIFLETASQGIMSVPTALKIGPGGSGAGGKISFGVAQIDWTQEASQALLLSADAVGAGAGGTISLNSGMANFGSGAGFISLSAVGGTVSGNGGTIQISAGSSKNVVFNSSAAINVQPMSKTGNGGTIFVAGGTLTNSSGSAITLNASPLAGGNGNGGKITMLLFNQLAVKLGNYSDGFMLLAQGGSAGGNGGSVQVSASSATSFQIGPSALSVSPLATNGNGGAISLFVTGTITLDPASPQLTLDASGKGTGVGGTISFSSNKALQLGTALGLISLKATGSSGGSISVNDSQDIFLDTTLKSGLATPTGLNVAATSAGGAGGKLTLGAPTLSYKDSASGALLLSANGGSTGKGGSVFVSLSGSSDIVVGSGIGQYDLSATGSDGGTVRFYASNAEVTIAATTVGTLANPTGLNVAASGKNGSGGIIDVRAKHLDWTNSAATALNLNVSGKGTGNGGSVLLAINSADNLTLGQGSSQIKLSASSGASGGNAGAFTLITQGNTQLDTNGLNLVVTGANGNGGALSLSSAAITQIGGGVVLLDVSGKGTGNGGTISISAGSDLSIGLNSGDLNLIAAGGASGGNGGAISVSTSKTITIDAAGLNVSGGGAAGNITLSGLQVNQSAGLLTAKALKVVSGFNPLILQTAVSSLDLRANGQSITVTNIGPVLLSNISAFNITIETAPDANGNGGIVLNGSSAVTGVFSASLTSSSSGTGTGGISQKNAWDVATINSPNITLSDVRTGGAGSAGASDINVTIGSNNNVTASLSINTSGNAAVLGADSISISNSAANSLSISTHAGSILFGQNISTVSNVIAFAIGFDSSATNLAVGGSLVARSYYAYTSGSFNDFTFKNSGNIQAANVLVSGLAGGNVMVENTGTLTATAGGINIVAAADDSLPGGNVLFDLGGGSMFAPSKTEGAINIVALGQTSASAGGINFSASQTFNGTTNLTAPGISQTIIISNGAAVVGVDALNVTTPFFSINSGSSIVGNPLTYNGGGFGSTIAHQGGDFDLTTAFGGSFVFGGSNLLILSDGGITDAGGPMLIDTSSASGRGGNITLMAGFDFTPVPPNPNAPDSITSFNISQSPSGSGSININNKDSKINSSGLTQGGTVNLFAHGGDVTVTNIDTSSANGSGGALTIIGQNVFLSASTANQNIITTTGGAKGLSGAVNISATDLFIGAPLYIQGGNLGGGQVGGGTGVGSITINAKINAGDATITLNAYGATGSVLNPFGFADLTGGNLSLNIGKDFGSVSNPISGTVPLLNYTSVGGSFNYRNLAPVVTLANYQQAVDYNLISNSVGGKIVIGANTKVIGTKSVSLFASGKGSQIDMEDTTGGIESPDVTLNTSIDGGAIGGTNAIHLTNTGAVSLKIDAGTTSTVNLTSDASTLTLNSTKDVASFSLVMAQNSNLVVTKIGNSIDTSTATSGTTYIKTSSSGTITINDPNPIKAVHIDLESDSTLTLSPTAGAGLTALTDMNGDGGTIKVRAGNLVLNSGAVTVFNANGSPGHGGSVDVFAANSIDIGGGNGELALTASGIVVGGKVSVESGNVLSLVAPSIDVSGSGSYGTITAAGGSIVQSSAFALTASNIYLKSTVGDIGSSGTPVLVSTPSLSFTASHDAYISNTGAVKLGQSSAGNTVVLSTIADGSGNGAITIGKGATITAMNLSLSADGTDGSKAISQEDNSQVVTLFAPTIQLFDVTSARDITVSVSQGATPVDFTAGSGPANTITITTDALTITGGNIAAGNVNILGLIGKDLTIDNQGLIQSLTGQTFIVGNPDTNNIGGSVFVKGGGTIGSGAGQAVFIQASTSADGSAGNVVEFTGSQNFTNDLVLTAVGNSQAVIVDKFAVVSLPRAVPPPTFFDLTVNSSILINNGTINANAIHMNTPSLAGTYASSNPIDLALLPNLVFSGQQLTILSQSDIVDSKSGGSKIDLSSSSIDGGTLYLLAGFQFSPTTSSGSPDQTTPYLITGVNTTPGNINLANTSIDTSCAVSSGTGSGGNVYAYASGSVSIGTINTRAGNGTFTGDLGGSVSIIGNGVSVGSINTSGGTAGNVNISAAKLAFAFNPGSGSAITVLNGQVFGGTILSGTPSGSVAIVGGGINSTHTGATESTVFLTASAANGNITSSGSIDTDNLILLAGSGGIGIPTNNLLTSAPKVTVNTTGSLYLKDSALTFSFVGDNTVAGVASIGSFGPSGGFVLDTGATFTGSTIAVLAKGVSILSNATLTATDVSLSSLNTITTFANSKINADNLTMVAATTIDLKGGQIIGTNATIKTQNAAGAITVESGVTISQSNKITLLTDSPVVLQGGSVLTADNISVTGTTGITINSGAKLNAHTLTFTSSGTLQLDDGLITALPTSVIGDGGLISVNAKNVASALPIVFNASSSGGGAGGNVQISTTDDLNIGTDPGMVQVKMLTSGNTGGLISLGSSGKVIFQTDASGNAIGSGLGIDATSAAIAASGLHLSVSTGVIDWSTNATKALILDVSGIGDGAGGQISLNLQPTSNIVVGKAAQQINLIAASGPSGGAGGQVSINAGTIDINPTGLDVAPKTVGDGGQISLTAAVNIKNALLGAPLTLNVNGSGSGRGGTINIDLTASKNAYTIGSGLSDNFILKADGGSSGGGGSVTVLVGGNLTVNQTGLSVNANGAAGDGGLMDLEAGQGTGNSGILLVTGNLSANGSGSGTGGAIVLASNSATLFNVGSAKTTNGVQGSLSVSGNGNGDLLLRNDGGALTLSQAVSQVDTINLIVGKNGTLTVSNNLGSSTTSLISLNTGGKLSAKTLQAANLSVVAGTSALTLATNVSKLDVTAGGTVTVTNTSSPVAPLEIQHLAGTALTVKSGGDITASGNITGTSVTLQSTGKTTGSITTQLPAIVTATTGGLTLTAVGGITINGAVNVATAAKLTVSGTSSVLAVNSTILGSNAKSTIALVSSGTNGVIQLSKASLNADAGVTLTAAKGSIIGTSSTIFANVKAVALSAANYINLGNGSITGATGITLKSTALASGTAITTGSLTSNLGNIAVSAKGNITSNGIVISNAAKGTIVYTASGTGAVIDIEGPVGATGAVAATTTKGGIIVGSSGMITSAASTVTLNAGNFIDDQGTINAGSSATLKTTIASNAASNFLSVGSITANEGLVSIVGAGQLVSTYGDALILAKSNFSKTKATITVENANKTVGTIVIGAGSDIETSGPGGGNVNISIGAPAKGVFGTIPTGAATYVVGTNSVTPTNAGPFFFGANSITVNSATAADVLMKSVNPSNVANKGQIIFSTGKLGVGAITVNGDAIHQTTILADPPALDATSVPVSLSLPSSVSVPTPASMSSSVSAPASLPSSGSPSLSFTAAPVNSALNTLTAPVPIPVATNFSGPGPGPGAVAGAGAGAGSSSATAPHFDWISDTEIVNGAIPAVMHGASNFGIRPDVSAFVDMDGEHTQVNLNRGSVLFAPSEDTTVQTPFGTISIAARSLVLVMAFGHGLAVYDLDDKRQAAVKVVSEGKSLVLAPGRSVVITHAQIERFEHVNPAQAVAYRGLQAHHLENGKRAFTAEFSTVSAANAILPMKQLVGSSHPQARRLAAGMLKTSAILATMRAGAPDYRYYVRPQLTASAAAR